MIRSAILGLLVAANLAGSLDAQAPRNPLDRYELTEPAAEFRLSNRLREISGLSVDAEGRLFAHDDERAVIYEIDQRTGDLVKGFAMGDRVARDDFEGVEVVGDRFYLVSSTGTIYESLEGDDDERVLFNTYGSGAGRACEIEGLAYEPEDRTLLLLCKTPRVDALLDRVTIFRWSLDARAPLGPAIAVALTDIERATEQRGFAASGMARDPVTGNYVLIASSDHAIIAITPDGTVLGGARLDRDRHPQAEGITFGHDGRLIIADEGRDGRARLTVYSEIPGGPAGSF